MGLLIRQEQETIIKVPKSIIQKNPHKTRRIPRFNILCSK